MVLVRLIDVLVIFVKILGGRWDANLFVRVLAWIALLSVAAVGFGLLVYAGVRVYDIR